MLFNALIIPALVYDGHLEVWCLRQVTPLLKQCPVVG